MSMATAALGAPSPSGCCSPCCCWPFSAKGLACCPFSSCLRHTGGSDDLCWPECRLRSISASSCICCMRSRSCSSMSTRSSWEGCSGSGSRLLLPYPPKGGGCSHGSLRERVASGTTTLPEPTAPMAAMAAMPWVPSCDWAAFRYLLCRVSSSRSWRTSSSPTDDSDPSSDSPPSLLLSSGKCCPSPLLVGATVPVRSASLERGASGLNTGFARATGLS
mmetsp:Transcript_1627/g.3999  ORF Transcript_1627/g.3999 Transcript_1627/m.3999 type:complete len:219 (-) Transcript_1627:50-706(-)